MSKFLKLFQRMEIIQRQMEQSCQTMHRLIHLGDTEFGRKQEFRRRFQSRRLSDMFNASLLENIRREAKEKCFEKIKHSQQVTLSRGMELVAAAQGSYTSASSANFNGGGEFQVETHEYEYPERKPIINMDPDVMYDSPSIQNQQQANEGDPVDEDVDEGLEHGPSFDVNEEPMPGCSKQDFGSHSKIIAVRSLRSAPIPSPVKTTDKNVTEDQRKSKCIFCGKNFPRLSYCLNHMLTIHPVNLFADTFPSTVTNEIVGHAVALLLKKTIGYGHTQGARGMECPGEIAGRDCFEVEFHLDQVVLELKKQLHLAEGEGPSLASEEETQAFIAMVEERVQKVVRQVSSHHSHAEGASPIRSSSESHKSLKHNSVAVGGIVGSKRKIGRGRPLTEPRQAKTPKESPKPPSRKRLFSEGTAHSSRSEEQIKCPYCDKQRTYPATTFPSHLKVKHPIQAFKAVLPPATTDVEFYDATKFVLSELRSSKNGFGCSECGKTYTGIHPLRYHLCGIHLDKIVANLKAKQRNEQRSPSSQRASPTSRK